MPNGKLVIGKLVAQMALERWFYGNIKTMPEMRVHIDGTPDVPNIVHPGDWITYDDVGFFMVVKTVKCKEGEWDYCPGAESWSIVYLGIGYMTGEKVSLHDCGAINGVVALDGKLLQLYKLGWNEREVRIVPKPDYVVVSKSAMTLVERERHLTMRAVDSVNAPVQLDLFTLLRVTQTVEGE
jgi:hypothetical protein